MLQFPRSKFPLVLHVAIAQRDFLTFLHIFHSMNRLPADLRVPTEARIGATRMIEARSVWENGGAGSHLHAVGLEDGYKSCRRTGACSVLF